MNFWWKEENWPRLKKDMERRMNTEVNGLCYLSCLELGEDPVPQQTVTKFLQGIDRNPITYKNAFSSIKKALLPQRKINYVEDITVTR